MSLLILPNHLGDVATAEGEAGLSSSTVATGYSRADLISGPRSKLFRLATATTAKGVGFTCPTLTPTHCVIARADYLLTTQGMRLRLREFDGTSTWSNVSGVDYNPITSANLIGIRSQDICIPFTAAQTRGFGASFTTGGATAESAQISKLYFSTAFDFGVPPEAGAQWEQTNPRQRFRPIYAYYEYEIEARLTLTWRWVTAAKIAAWRALPQLLNWPLFLYDENADFWEYKLEHVLVADFSEQLMANDAWSITVTFARLKHYA